MMDTDTPHVPEQQSAGHALWLAMQSAYGEYRDASSALELAGPQTPSEPASPEEVLRFLEALRGQRAAFEHYIESRMQFSEYLCDRHEREIPVPDTSATPHIPPQFGMRRSVVYALATALLGTTSFLLAREWRHVRDLEVAHDEVRATLNQTRSALQALKGELDRRNPEPQLAARKSEGAPAKSDGGPTARAPAPVTAKPTGQPQWRAAPTPLHVQRKQAPKKRNAPAKTTFVPPSSKAQVRVLRPGAQNHYEFSLAPSRDFQRAGPIRMSLRAVNRERNSVDLTLMWDGVQLDEKNVKLREPHTIRLGGRQAPLELVVTRIDRDRVQGYLTEPKSNQSERAANDVRRRMADSP